MYNPSTDDTPENLIPQIVWSRNTNQDVMEFFPFKTIRPQQEKAIREIVEAYKTKRIVILEGPCGSGKSAIIMTLANYFGTAHLLTPLKALQTQYLSDFPDLADSRGKSNYICEYDYENRCKNVIDGVKLFPKNCANAPCTKKGFKKPDSCIVSMREYHDRIITFDNSTIDPITGKVISFSGCPYQVAKMIAGQTPIICHNFDSFLYQNLNPKGGYNQRPFLAVDECHNFEGKIINFNGVTVPEELMMPGDSLADIKNTEEFYDFFCKQTPYTYQDMMKFCDNEKELFMKKDETSMTNFTRARFFVAAYNYWNANDDNKQANEYNEIAEKVIRLGMYIQKKQNCEYEFETQDRKGKRVLTGLPLYAGLFSGSILLAGQKVLLTSATILNHKIFCRSIGIKHDETEFIQIESDFPKEKRVIKKTYVGSMSYKNKNDTLPKLVEKIDELLDQHVEKGLIHSHTFDITRYIFNNSRHKDRLITMDMCKGFNAKEALIDLHTKADIPSVIIDPACDQGVDLPDDLCRFQCMVKVPYPSLSKWMKAKMEQPGGQDWYTMQAALKFVQSYGRGNRHNNDFCVHYLLDSDFDRFLSTCKSKGLIPNWIYEAIERKVIVFK